jgi:predicted RNase H-like HicB family nuclease
MATRGVAVKPAAEDAELARLRAENAELEREVERLENALLDLQVSVLQGYAVALWPAGDGSFLATCPRLHASVQEDSKEEALRSLGEAMEVVKDGMAYFGDPVPPPDVE